MNFIRKFILTVFAVFGATAGFLIIGILNLVFSLHFSFSEVFTYGLLGGLMVGLIMGWIFTIMLLRWAKKKLVQKLGSFSGVFNRKLFR
jgi:hypothetical protein